MDPLLKEFVLFFAVWPVVIVATIFIGMRMGKYMSGRQDTAARGPALRSAVVATAAKPVRQPG